MLEWALKVKQKFFQLMNYKWFWNTFSSFGYSVLFSSFFPFISRDPISKIGILFPYAASLRKKSSEIKKGSYQDLLLLGGLYFKPFESNSVLGFLLQQVTSRLTKRNMNSAVTNLPIVFLWDFVQYLQWLPPWIGKSTTRFQCPSITEWHYWH